MYLHKYITHVEILPVVAVKIVNICCSGKTRSSFAEDARNDQRSDTYNRRLADGAGPARPSESEVTRHVRRQQLPRSVEGCRPAHQTDRHRHSGRQDAADVSDARRNDLRGIGNTGTVDNDHASNDETSEARRRQTVRVSHCRGSAGQRFDGEAASSDAVSSRRGSERKEVCFVWCRRTADDRRVPARDIAGPHPSARATIHEGLVPGRRQPTDHTAA